ncbi:MAG: YdbH domain-containing protein, partial [Pseudomonadota bacterium]
LYEPLTGRFTANFNNADMSLSGPLQLVSTGQHIADVSARIDLRRLNGTARAETPVLVFQEDGLQPRDLTDRVRGLLTNARGTMQAEADFNILSGQLSGTSRFTVTDLGFDTLRLGPVDGVNGSLYFDDIIAITTPPKQTVTIDRLDPGVVLTDGRLQFQILEGQKAQLEAAEWPFAGGRLFVEPTLWTIAGTTDTINVKAEQIELSDVVEALNVPDMQAEGTISGTFPIELRSGNTYIRDARFAVDEDGGSLRYTGSALNAVGGGNQIVSDAFRALQDLQYTVLELGLDGNLLGEISLKVLLLGKNPDVLNGAEFEFDVTIDSELAQLLQAGQRATSSQWLAEAVATQVREGPPPQE